MTCIVAVVTPQGAWIGADSLSSSDEGLASISATPKVSKFGDLLVGFAGNWRQGQRVFEVLSRTIDPTIETIIKSFKPEGEELELLVVQDRRIFEVQADLGIIESKKVKGFAYGAVGSGAATALGALYLDHEDEGSIGRALEATEEHNTKVRKPFIIIGAQ